MIYLILKIGLQRYGFQFKNQNWGEKDLSVRGLKENNFQLLKFNFQCAVVNAQCSSDSTS